MTIQSLRQYINTLPPHIRSRQQAALLMECEARLTEATRLLGTLITVTRNEDWQIAEKQAQRFIEQLNRKD